jgi:murein DD-endopeptidase MepM/ murein hydrolase activator NlpD
VFFVNDARPHSVFGRRKEPHTVIIARGDQIRHFTIRPWVAALCGCILVTLAIGYLSATTYLVLRDDLLGSAAARQARMQQAYEDRISMLRAQVDRITSRQLLDQQVVESKVDELLERQTKLSERQGRLDPILQRAAAQRDGALPSAAPLPEERPDLRARLGDASGRSILNAYVPTPQVALAPTAAERADQIFSLLTRSLHGIEEEQVRQMEALAAEAFETVDQITTALETAGLKLDGIDEEESGLGGPFLPLDDADRFEATIEELDVALARLDTARAAARDMPIHNPAPGQSISSNFGPRRDPFLRRPAMHAGMDFRARTGTPILAGGAGKVVAAGWAGGYGRLVEIDHGNGYSTRYAHMSKITVSKGDEVSTGDQIGLVGSTGRSTGPHLHYEVRRNGKAVDPMRFIRAGRQVKDLL